VGLLDTDLVRFSLLWIVAAVQFGPNALNCVYVAALGSFRASLCAVAGIAAVSVLYMELIYVGKELFFVEYKAYLNILQWLGVAWIVYLGITKVVASKWAIVGGQFCKNRSQQRVMGSVQEFVCHFGY
jgi:threonine/homoserine/homoserine lactone efflux protein